MEEIQIAQLKEEMFAKDLLELYDFAIYKDKNFRYFMESYSIEDFTEKVVNKNARFEKMHTLINARDSVFLKKLNEQRDKVIKKCEDEKNQIKDITENEEEEKVLRILFKFVKIHLDNNIDTFKSVEIQEIYNLLEEDMSYSEVISYYYLLHHFEEFELGQDDKILSCLISPHIKAQLIKYQYIGEDIENKKLKEEIKKDKIELKHKDKAIKNLEKKVEKYKNKKNEYKSKYKTEIEKIENRNKNEYKERIKQKNKEISSLKDIIKDYKENYIKEDKYQKLKNENTSIQDKLKQEKDKKNHFLEKLKNQKEYDLIEELENFLSQNGMTEEMIQTIYPYYEDYLKGIKPDFEIQPQTEKKLEGICLIENGIHYIKIQDKDKQRIFNIPEETYLAQNQIIIIDEEYRFIKASKYRYNENKKAQEDIEFTLDNYIDSIRSKNHQIYIVTKVIPSGLIYKTINDKMEKFLEINTDIKIEESNMLFMKKNRIIKHMNNIRFLTKSKLYNKYDMGHVEVENSKVFINKSNGEKVILKKIPTGLTIQDGTPVKYDEYDNFIDVLPYEEKEELSVERKILNAKSKSEKIPNSNFPEEIHIKDEVILIIGNIKFSDSYTLSLLKIGYKSTTISGFESWHKIEKEARAADIIIFITEHASHENYYSLKEDFADKIIYSKTSGANRIAQMIREEMILEKGS